MVRRRGRYMQEAVPVGQGAMAAILGLDADGRAPRVRGSGAGRNRQPGEHQQPRPGGDCRRDAAVQRAAERAKALAPNGSCRCRSARRSIARMMKPAEERLAPELRALAVQDPRVPIVANVDAQPKRDAASAIDALVGQVSSPVLWEDIVHRLASEGVTTYVEVGPGRVLSGLVKKINKDANVFAFGGPDDLGAILASAKLRVQSEK